ncbi:MAG: hypothetical protein K2W85_13410 [Phycisphaerales bacterium]|nr:hypothetical protein [Phycisphaerales bacterium]
MADTHGQSHSSASKHAHATTAHHDAVDSWHDHSHDEKPQHAHAETVNSGMVLGVGVFLFVLIVVACVIVYAFYIGATTRTLEKRELATADAPAKVFREWKGQSLIRLESGGTLQVPAGEEGKTKNITLVPIKDAAKGVIAEYAGKATAGK